MVEIYIELHVIHRKIKRSLIPVKGKGLRITVLQANPFCWSCTVTIKHGLTGTPFTINHYPKEFEGSAMRNRESFTRVFKVTIWCKRRDLKLYQTLTYTTDLDNGRFFVIVSIPLLDNRDTFEIFNIFNMAVPAKDPVVPTDKLPSMVVWCRLNTCSIAVNLAQIKYVLWQLQNRNTIHPVYDIIVMSEALYIPWLLVSYLQLHYLWKIQRM